MAKKEAINAQVTIRRVLTWRNLAPAARLLDVTETQVRRHINGGEGYSEALARRMLERGVVVERN